MSRYTRSSLLMVAATIASTAVLPAVNAQDPPAGGLATFPATPLADKRFSYPTGIPYQVDTEDLIRGRQAGYNICNSTTENQESMCQTSFINHLDDFCIWAPPNPNSEIGATEHEEVAWCTKPGRGTRLIPEDTLTGLQYISTPDYIQIVGFFDGTKVNIAAGDFGGELDPHGADLRGNPLGGIVYSNAFPGSGGSNETFEQVIEWHLFIGADSFCYKACDPAGPNAARFCEHIYDRIGCTYNIPNRAQPGVFERCEGDNQDFPGIYTVDGVELTYTQPEGAIETMPYEPRVPASSNCVQFESAQLFVGLPTATGASTTTSGATGAPTGTGRPNGGGATTRSGTASGAGPTDTANAARAVVAGRTSDNGGFAGAVIALTGVALTAMLIL